MFVIVVLVVLKVKLFCCIDIVILDWDKLLVIVFIFKIVIESNIRSVNIIIKFCCFIVNFW